MATTNGTLTPPSLPPAPSSPGPAKRKRSDTEPAIQSNGASTEAATEVPNGTNHSLQTVLEDILAVLKSYDPRPSILSLPITTSIIRSTSGEAATKRTKVTPCDGPTTITSLVQDGSYESLDELAKDVEIATDQILAPIDSSEISAARQLSLEETRLQTRVLAFRKVSRNLILREEHRRARPSGKADPADSDKQESNSASNNREQSVQINEEGPESRTVLTLYGSAQGPRQLFSSLQQPTRVAPLNRGATSGLDTSVGVMLPLRESSLPNILSTTEVFPLPEGTDRGTKKVATFGEAFPAPANLPQLSPPKLAKQLTTRERTISFVPHDSLPKANRKSSYTYTTQNLSTGQWLGYGGVDMPKDPTSPTAKQKSRQRALSTGEAQLPPSEVTLAAVQQAKEDALFRSAYSSFAPSRDDAAAIVPEETKNKVWWQKVGEKRFNDIFPIDPVLLGREEPFAATESSGASDEKESFKDAAENFTPIEQDKFTESGNKTDLEKNTDEVLQEISELLETLASYQRIRNLSLATNPRTPVIQNSSLASLAGSPSSPSAEEIDVYQMLKSQLTLMISQLPPYAVAKLNGDQLEELNISRTILIETQDHKGVLEEDQISRMTKAVAISAAAGTPSLSRMASSGLSTHSQYPPASTQYARSTPSVHSSAARPVQASQSYYPQQSLQRTPSMHYQRSSTGPTQTYQASTNYTSSTPRASYPATQTYGQQTPRPYGQGATGQYYPQRPAPQSNYGAVTNSQFYQSTSQPQSHSRYPQQTQNGYYQRPQSTVPMPNYTATPSPHMRTGSPLKANQPPPQPTYHSSRPAYGTPVAGAQMRSSYYAQPVSQPMAQYGTPQPSTPSTVAPTSYNSITSDHQQLMMDRQRAQLAAQPQARMAAQNSFNRQGSGTPQPPNGQYGGQPPVNGAPMVA
ncbi:hypothetical protein K469DRAFT_676649 [Zopfia rhizophila CBS 207.26]|uniref:Uncharacterized protein n=1 Tax=Zopfia rhizophila CBS 207.26 TaxID=1314779 RepID=A0A6A6DG54_9PEZI|nr:hypothetical protein K469DRAFT_676649 [Zopfia rhizophila CBS 207.26]